MSSPRTLDSMYGTGITPEEAPHVERVVDGEDYSVDVDLTPAAATLIKALAEAVSMSAALRGEFALLMASDGTDQPRRDHAVQTLFASAWVRQALTIRLTPRTADHLWRALDDAALEPARCDQYDHGDTCHNYAAEGETACPRHLPLDPQP